MNAPIKRLPLMARSEQPIVPSLEHWRLRSYIMMLAGDGLLLLLAFFIAGGAYLGDWPAEVAMMEAWLLLPVYGTIALFNSVYSIKALTSLRYAIQRSWVALAISSGLLIFITFYTKSTTDFSRGVFSIALVLAAVLFTLLRAVIIRYVRRAVGPSVANVLLIDDGGPMVQLANAFNVKAKEHDLNPDLSDPFQLDRIGRYLLNMDRVVVSCPVERRQDWTLVMRAAGIRGEVVSYSLEALRPIGLQVDGDCISLIVSSGPLGLRDRVMKRAFDLTLAGGAFIILLPLLAIIALIIKLEDGGPVFFVQRRLGRGNRFFQMVKFRSMRVEKNDSDGNRSVTRDDDRCTRIGRFIRKTSIDELPQLLNVLRGEMSIVSVVRTFGTTRGVS